jgi:hypothetical protein
MLKKFLFTGFVYLLFNTSFSQTISHQRKEDLNIKKFHQAVVSINPPEDFISIPVNSISVVDARPDSSAIGLYQLFKLEPRFIVTPAGFGTETDQYIKKYVHCSKSDSCSVVMVLRKFWISTNVHKYDGDLMWDKNEDTSKGINVSLFTNIEYYLLKDAGYYALYRFDSTFTGNIKKPINIANVNTGSNKQKSYVGLLIQEALETSLSKMETMDWKKNFAISTKRKFTWSDIAAHEQKTFDIPALKDSLPIPGVYLTFEEFKTNNPSVTQFEVTKDKLNDFIYVKRSDGRQVSLPDVWGYCDSSHQMFVKLKYNFFKLQRRQNAFYIYGSNQTIHEFYQQYYGGSPGVNGSPSVPGGSTTVDDYILPLKPFQLEWETGDMY